MDDLRRALKEIPTRLKRGELQICVVGLGRIGLPTASLFAEAGAKVLGVDVNPRVVEEVNSGRCRFTDEPGLGGIVREAASSGRLKATTDLKAAAAEADVAVVCVPTPVDEAKTPDYSIINSVAHSLGRAMRRHMLIVVESTVGPGVVEGPIRGILEGESGLKAGLEFGLASCPERADPGNIVANMRSVPRIVGGIDRASTDAAADLYRAALGVRVVKVSSPKVANAVKLTENLFRDVNIALANEFALLYEKLGIDTMEVINACATKYNFMPHYPGPGVGGPCLPSNPYYLIAEGVKVGNIPYLVRMAREINDRMPDHVVNIVSEALNETGRTVKESRIAILGVAYKPDVKDAQLSPVERIQRRLREMGAIISIYDPYFKGEEIYGTRVAASLEEAVRGADCILIGTAHREFSKIDINSMHSLARSHAALVDTRSLVSPRLARRFGFIYRSVGRPKG